MSSFIRKYGEGWKGGGAERVTRSTFPAKEERGRIRLLGGSKIGVSIALVAILLAVVVSSGAIAASSSQPLFATAMRDPDFRILMMELRTEGYEIEISAVQQNSE